MSGGAHEAPSLKCHPGLLLATLGLCWTQRPSRSGELSRARFVTCLGPGHPDSLQPLGPATGPLQHPNEQDGAVSTILCWTQTVLQTRPDGLPKGSAAWISPSLGAPLSGSPAPPRLCLGRARAIKRQLRLVQRTRVGLLGLFMSCCDLSWPEPCSDQAVLRAFSLP